MDPVRLDHIALGLWDITEAPALLVGVLGGVTAVGGPGVGYRGGQWAFQDGARIEVIEPAGLPSGFLHRFLEGRGPGVHHVTFKVPSLRTYCDRAEARGYDIVGYDDSCLGWKEAFLHPRQAQGIVVQLAEVDPNWADGWGPDWDAPPVPRDPPPPVRILGLRLLAQSAESALQQWQGILDGACTGTAEGFVFRWPDSPIRIAVTIDEQAPAGPLAIEVAADRPLELPAAPHPTLGAWFREMVE
jgi:methylmalonyl-CoA/ethylmalonyl-CoA epimerase